MTTETLGSRPADASARRPRDVRVGMVVPFDMALDREYWQFLPDHVSVLLPLIITLPPPVLSFKAPMESLNPFMSKIPPAETEMF